MTKAVYISKNRITTLWDSQKECWRSKHKYEEDESGALSSICPPESLYSLLTLETRVPLMN